MNRKNTQHSAKNFRPPPAWPFFVADGVLILLAALIIHYSEPGIGPILLAAVILVLGVIVFIAPYLLAWYGQLDAARARRDNSVREVSEAGLAAAAQLEISLAKAEEAVVTIKALTEEADGRAERAGETGNEDGPPGKDEKPVSEEIMARLERLSQERRKSEKAFGRRLDEVTAAVAELRERIDSGGEDAAVLSAMPVADTSDEAIDGISTPDPEEKLQVEEESGAIEAEEVPRAKTPKSAARPKKNPVKKELDDGLFSTTTLLATAFIGAGNKLFVRGDGPGLSWEKGIPMQFLEIGRWGWTTSEANGPIRLRVYKNDTEPDPAGDYVLEPESALEVRPDFEAAE